MIDCDEALAELEAYLDGELPEVASHQVEQHLFGCQSCFDRSEFRRRVRDIVRSKCGIRADIPAGVAERIRRMIAADQG
jgi:anti-sigma factor (TIGR02949 family)